VSGATVALPVVARDLLEDDVETLTWTGPSAHPRAIRDDGTTGVHDALCVLLGKEL
jgi:hypothetical protein